MADHPHPAAPPHEPGRPDVNVADHPRPAAPHPAAPPHEPDHPVGSRPGVPPRHPGRRAVGRQRHGARGRVPARRRARAGPGRVGRSGRRPEPRDRRRGRLGQRRRDRRRGRRRGRVDRGRPYRRGRARLLDDAVGPSGPGRAVRPGRGLPRHGHAGRWGPEGVLPQRPAHGRAVRRAAADRAAPARRWIPNRRVGRRDDRSVCQRPGRPAGRRAGGRRSAPRPGPARRADRTPGRRGLSARWAAPDGVPRPAGCRLGG